MSRFRSRASPERARRRGPRRARSVARELKTLTLLHEYIHPGRALEETRDASATLQRSNVARFRRSAPDDRAHGRGREAPRSVRGPSGHVSHSRTAVSAGKVGRLPPPSPHAGPQGPAPAARGTPPQRRQQVLVEDLLDLVVVEAVARPAGPHHARAALDRRRGPGARATAASLAGPARRGPGRTRSPARRRRRGWPAPPSCRSRSRASIRSRTAEGTSISSTTFVST